MTEENSNLPEGKQYGNEFLSNHFKSVIFTRISTTSPIIIFPILSLCFHDWYLLFGILFSYFGGFLSIQKIWIIIVLVLTVLYSLIFGFVLKSYVNIFFLCYLYGHITFSLGRYFMDKVKETKSKMEKEMEIHMNQKYPGWKDRG